MKKDLYTKAILTATAVCLAVITVEQAWIGSRAKASSGAPSLDEIKTNYGGSINVRIVGMAGNATLPVEIKSYPSGGLPVEVKSMPYGGVPVEVKNRSLPVEMSRTVDVNVKNSYIYTKQY